MCHSFLCQQTAQWVRANPAELYVAGFFVALTLFRLVRRGRWPVIALVLAVWAIAAGFILFIG